MRAQGTETNSLGSIVPIKYSHPATVGRWAITRQIIWVRMLDAKAYPNSESYPTAKGYMHRSLLLLTTMKIWMPDPTLLTAMCEWAYSVQVRHTNLTTGETRMTLYPKQYFGFVAPWM